MHQADCMAARIEYEKWNKQNVDFKPTTTVNLSYGKKLLLPKGSAKKLAKIVYKNLDKNYRKIYYPSWWAIIVFIIKILPFSLIRYIYKFL